MLYISSQRFRPAHYIVMGLIVIFAILWVHTNISYAHGGKKHAASGFTAFQAVQKAIAVYDKLIVAGKLDESWEIDLRNVEVITREKNGKWEYRVSFQRSEGSPDSVYIFYSDNGEYAGSNFDGS